MPTIISLGCVKICTHCATTFSFVPSEVGVSFRNIPAGHSPEEEAYEKPIFVVNCPNCKQSVNVDTALGSEGKRAAVERAKRSKVLRDHDL